MVGLLNPRQGMKTREIPGGTGPQAVSNALTEARERLGKLSVGQASGLSFERRLVT